MAHQDRIIINTRERLVSDDINRAQALEARQRCELALALHGRRRPSIYQQPGVDEAPTAPLTGPFGSTHLLADVYGGLMVRPDLANALLIDPGVAGFYAPSLAGADDSGYVLVSDAGVTSTATLPFTPNASGSTRWDCVECQPVDTVSETASRDVYDLGTRQFAPVTLDKRSGAALTYRIRLGTPGAGPPAPDPAWMPIAMIFVRDGAVGFTQADVYDVRPLVADRLPMGDRLFNGVSPTVTRTVPVELACSSPDGDNVYGWALADGYGYPAGGDLRRSTPSSIADFGAAGDAALLDLSIADNRSAALVLGANALVTLVAGFPWGLPRWVRYRQAGPTRLPAGPRGIVFLAPAAVQSANGMILSTVVWPTICAMGSVSGFGVTLANIATDSASALPAWSAAGKSIRLGRRSASALVGRTRLSMTVQATTAVAIGALLPGTHFPAAARTVRVRFSADAAISSNPINALMRVVAGLSGISADMTTGPWEFEEQRHIMLSDAWPTGFAPFNTEIEIPVGKMTGVDAASAAPLQVGLILNGPLVANIVLQAGTVFADVVGWSY